MIASNGVVEETVVRPVAAKISITVSPTPSRAVMSGIPAARKDPSVSHSTIRAITTPSPSVMVIPGRLSL
jgi:hypothetical protein